MKKSWEEKREKVESLTKSMDEAIEQYFKTPEQMKDYLSFMSRFYQYSPRNISLINEQFQGAKAVGSFKFWKEKGFSVKKGEKGIEVLVPNQTVPKFKDENGKWKNMKYATEEEKELESNEKSLEKPVLVTSKKGQQIMRDLEPLGMFYYQEKNGDYVGIDNTDGEAFVEQFEDFGTCQKWLTNQNFKYYTELNYGKGKERLHWYETSRPISHGTQPTGFVEWDEEKGKYGLVAYKQPLTQQELEKFKMKPLKEEKEQMKVGEKEKGEQERE